MPVQQAISVFVIEDNRQLRDGIVKLLNAHPDMRVVAAVGSPDVALPRIQETRPRVVLVDAGLRARDSHRLVGGVGKTAPEVRVIVMELLPAQEDVTEFVRAGASGFILKGATTDEVMKTIRSVAAGREVLPLTLARTLVAHLVRYAAGRPAPEVVRAVRMTKREREVTDLISQGLSNKEIAERLYLSTSTIKSHVHNILEKLALRNRVQIAAFSHENRKVEARIQ